MTYLVGPEHVLIKDPTGDRLNQRVSNPGSVMTGSDLAKLVSTDFVHSDFVGLGIIFNGDLRGHATHSSDLAPMASLDEEPDIGVHEMYGHSDIFTVGKNSATVSPTLLDETEDVIPAKNRGVRKGAQI